MAIGAVELQSVTSGCYTVTAEAAGSSPVVPAIFSKLLQLTQERNVGPIGRLGTPIRNPAPV